MTPPSAPAGALPLRHALLLGALHGPAELLPVSSSGHVALVPWLAGWPYTGLDDDLRKAFEVALHAGTAVALLVAWREEVLAQLRALDGRELALLAAATAPAAAAGLMLEGPIEARLGTPGGVAGGLAAGALALWAADARGPRGVGAAAGRTRAEATPADGLAVGLAQALALVPGLSRNGMTLAAARARGLRRGDANVLSRHVALPVVLGATALKGARLARRGLPPGLRAPFLAGAAASFAATLAARRVVRLVEADRSVAPVALYRLALAGTAGLARLRGWRA